MKKEFVAIYIGLALFFGALIAGAILSGIGHPKYTEVSVCSGMIFFGLTVFAGLYSNAKNYGFFDIGFISRKYTRITKGTKGYLVGVILTAILFGAGPILFAIVVLTKKFTGGHP